MTHARAGTARVGAALASPKHIRIIMWRLRHGGRGEEGAPASSRVASPDAQSSAAGPAPDSPAPSLELGARAQSWISSD